MHSFKFMPPCKLLPLIRKFPSSFSRPLILEWWQTFNKKPENDLAINNQNLLNKNRIFNLFNIANVHKKYQKMLNFPIVKA